MCIRQDVDFETINPNIISSFRNTVKDKILNCYRRNVEDVYLLATSTIIPNNYINAICNLFHGLNFFCLFLFGKQASLCEA